MKKTGLLIFIITCIGGLAYSAFLIYGIFGGTASLLSLLLFPVTIYAFPVYAAIAEGALFWIFPVVFYGLQILALLLFAAGRGNDKLPGGEETEDAYECIGFARAFRGAIKNVIMAALVIAAPVAMGSSVKAAFYDKGIWWLLPVAVAAVIAVLILLLFKKGKDSRYDFRTWGKRNIIIAAVLVAVFGVSSLFGYNYFFGPPYSTYNLSSYVKVGQYKGLKVDAYSITVTQKEVDKRIKKKLKAAATTKTVKKGTVKDGDTVNIDYVGKVNGKTFSGGSSDNYDLTIGSGTFIDGFEDGLIGVDVGDTVKLKLTFPDDYSTEKLAGKDVVYTVTVNSKEVKEVPELTVSFVKQHSKQTTVAGYKKAIKKQLYEEKKEDAIDDQKSDLWNQVVTDSKVKKYPQRELDSTTQSIIDEYETYADQYSMTLKKFLKQYMGISSVNAFKVQAGAYAKVVVKQEMVVYYIADKEGITVSKKEYNDFIEKTLKSYNYTEKSFKEAQGQSYEDAVGKNVIEREIYLEKVKDFLLDNAKVVEKSSD